MSHVQYKTSSENKVVILNDKILFKIKRAEFMVSIIFYIQAARTQTHY